MKREILCVNCAAEVAARYKLLDGEPVEAFPGEFMMLKIGELKIPSALCDSCVPAASMGMRATVGAYSIWTKENPYTEWEQDYIEVGAAKLPAEPEARPGTGIKAHEQARLSPQERVKEQVIKLIADLEGAAAEARASEDHQGADAIESVANDLRKGILEDA